MDICRLSSTKKLTFYSFVILLLIFCFNFVTFKHVVNVPEDPNIVREDTDGGTLAKRRSDSKRIERITAAVLSLLAKDEVRPDVDDGIFAKRRSERKLTTVVELTALTKDDVHLFNGSVIPFRTDLKNPCFLTKDDRFLAASADLETAGSQLRCLPYFFVLGYTKCGSTEFYSRMSQISKIGKSRIKETHYWDNNMNRNHNTMLSYMNNLNTAALYEDSDVIFGDFTPRSVWHSEEFDFENNISLAYRVHSLLPKSKLIVIVRNPTDRLLSDFNFYLSGNGITAEYFHLKVVEAIEWWNHCRTLHSFRQCIYGHHFDLNQLKPMDTVKCDNIKHMPFKERKQFSQEQLLYLNPFENRDEFGNRPLYPGQITCDFSFNWRSNGVDRLRVGIYHVYLEEWLKYFPRDRLKVFLFDDYIANPVKVVEEALKFLDISDYDVRHQDNVQTNRSKHKVKMLNETRRVLDEFYRPFNVKLAQLLGDERLAWRKID